MADPAGKTLVVLIGGRHAGLLAEDSRGRHSFTYDAAWQQDPDATPLSLSMPLAGGSFGDTVVRAFLWGLLPDNDRVIARWAREHQVSPQNPFALLHHVGEDCAGAVQFLPPDRVDDLLAGRGDIEWLDEQQVAERLRRLRDDPTAWHAARTGQFSLAGAQAKTALHRDPVSQRWGVPHGAVPTTHILKPAVRGLDDHDLNEHLCLETIRLLGLPGARSHVASFGDERAVVVERYDRRRADDGRILRIHQEDTCQALGYPPTAKYQNEGGPRPEQIVRLIRDEVDTAGATADVRTFVEALALNWVLGGTDAHAKNYSVLLSGGQVRLAPLYDVASALPYEQMYLPKLKMAMKIGGEYRMAYVRDRHWRRLADDVGLEGDELVSRVHELATQVPDRMAAAASDPAVQALGVDLPARLVDAVGRWAASCRQALE